MSSTRTTAGGAATIGGVIYQLLWYLLELSRFEILDAEQDADGVLTRAVLRLEPEGGGGDARLEGEGVYIVTQLKARSGGGTWSLQEVITQVLPDLLKGIRLDARHPKYRFVTEGRMGRWEEVRRFFSSLGGRNPDEIATLLATQHTLNVGARLGAFQEGRTPFWDKAAYTPKELVDKIVITLLNGDAESKHPEFRERVLHLLTHFEFCEPLSVEDAESRIDAALSERADYVEDVPGTRHRLLARLAELAREGAKVKLGTFLASEGLDALPASHIGKIVARGREVLDARLRNLRFRSDQHVQEEFTEDLADLVAKWPIVLVTGESGSGKSWHCCAIADLLARRGAIVAHVEAGPDADTTLDRAMSVLWNTIKGNDSTLRYDRAAQRLHGPPPQRVLVIDRVESPLLARHLAVADCSSVQLRLVVGCTKEAAEAAKEAASERCWLEEVKPFSPGELNDYLAARLVPRWDSIPADVRAVLQAPLLARLYCETVGEHHWRPSNEYDLYDRYWQTRLSPTSGVDPTLDLALLRELARAFLRGEPYPWTADRMHALVKHEASFARLRKSGILSVRPDDGACEVWHDRLLNWLVAMTLAEDAVSGVRSAEDTGRVCADTASGELRPSGKYLGYVAMDTVWHLASRGAHSAAASILSSLEASPWRPELYTELVPTIGPRVVGTLLHRLDQLLAIVPSYTTTDVANCLGRIESPEVTAKARTLLANSSSEARTVALNILRRHGDPDSLDRVWDLHLTATEEQSRGLEYERRMDVLAAGIRRRPSWLVERLVQATSSTPNLTDLVYQLARLSTGAEHWARLKPHLKAIVPAQKPRSLLRCIIVFRDRTEIEYLRTHVDREEDFAGDMALAALSKLDPDIAVADLAVSNLRQLILTRKWHLQLLLAARPEAAQEAVRLLVQRRGEPWALCEMYSGAENEIDRASFELVLDHVATCLRAELATGTPDPSSGPLHGPLTFVERIVAPDLVAQLRARKGTDLPTLLGAYLLAIGYRDDINARLTDRPALRVLQRIGDPILCEWVKHGLRAKSQYGRFDALQEAHKHADKEVIALLREVALALEDKERFDSYLAVHALTALQEWQPIIEVTIAVGLSMSPHPFTERRGSPALTGEYVEALLSRFKGETATPGMLLAAGLIRDPRFLEPVVRTATRDDIPEDVALSAAIAAELLGVKDEAAVQPFARRLRGPNVQEQLPSLVLQMGTPTAFAAIEEYLRRHFDPALCAALAQREGWADRAAALAWEHRSKAERTMGFEAVLPLLASVGGVEARKYLERLAFGIGRGPLGHSVRIQAVKALSELDKERAYDAALGAARDESEKERARFPALLIELDPARAVPALLELIRSGDAEEFDLAVADAVASSSITGQIEDMLSSDNTAVRRAGCVLAGRRPVTETLTRLLRERAIDVDESVARAAMTALWEGLRARGVRILAEEGVAARGERRWVAIDHAIAMARGRKGVPPVRPDALAPLDQKLSAFEADSVNEALRKGKEEYRRGIEDRARRRRS